MIWISFHCQKRDTHLGVKKNIAVKYFFLFLLKKLNRLNLS